MLTRKAKCQGHSTSIAGDINTNSRGDAMEINPYSRELSPSSTLHRLTPSYVRHASKSHFSGPMRFQEAKPIDRQTTKGYVECYLNKFYCVQRMTMFL